MILPNDIIVRTTSDGTTIWVSQRLIVECCGIGDEYMRLSRVRYKKSLPASWQKVATQAEFTLSDSGKGWRWGRRGGQYYYDLARIPDRAPAYYRSALPPREELEALVEDQNLTQSRGRQAAARALITEAVKQLTDNTDARWINTQSGYQIDLQTCRDYAKSLAWCRFVSRTVKERRTIDYGTTTITAFYDACTEALIPLRIAGLRVSSATSLRNKVATLPAEVEDQRAWIISGKVGNSNRQIVGKIPLFDPTTGEIYKLDIHQAIMYAAYMNVDGPQKEHLHALYNEMYVPAINDFGQIPVAERTFCNHLTRFCTRLKTDLARHGTDYYKKHYLPYTPTEKLSYAHSLFAADGSGLIGYRYNRIGRNAKGKAVDEIKVMNLYAILISDVASGYIAGYGIAPEGAHKETLDMVKCAVRMAVGNGGNQTMFEIVSDNHGAFSSDLSKDYLKKAFNRVRRIAPNNSQANPAETQFRLFKNSTLRSQKNFIRTSHNATTANRANTETMDAYDYPTYTEVVEQLTERVNVWNNKPRGNGKTPAQMFTENKNPECQPLDATALRSVNGATTKLSVERMRGFITPEGKNATVQYEIPNFATEGAEAISRATGNRYDSEVLVTYDETGADLYSRDGRFIMTCPVTAKSKSAYIETTDDHRAARRHHDKRKVTQLEAVEQHQADTFAAIEHLNDFDYTTAVQLGARKEDINGAAEAQINTIITEVDKKKAIKTRRALERKEARTAEKTTQKEADDRRSRRIAREAAKFNKRTENQNQQ